MKKSSAFSQVSVKATLWFPISLLVRARSAFMSATARFGFSSAMVFSLNGTVSTGTNHR